MKKLVVDEKTIKEVLSELLSRKNSSYDEREKIVRDIIEDVRTNGDRALFSYTKKFDGADIDEDNVRVSESEIEEAYKNVSEDFLSVIRKAIKRIRAFHERQRQNSWFEASEGTILGQRVIPIERAGVYAPGGKAAYPSSVLMNVIPAQVAGVSEIILLTPCGKDGHVDDRTVVAAKEAGVNAIYKAGGAQAIAAMAYGTKSIPKCMKITGPGNIFVALAKKQVFGSVGIDSVAGPSEITVLTDGTGNPKYIASDLLSQAEHDEMASSILVTTSKDAADAIEREINVLVPTMERKGIIEKSLSDFGYILITDTMEEAIECVNAIAPEHLEIITKDPFSTMTYIKNAGAVFLGEYSSEPLGDYFAGPNHILPTGGTAKFFSALSVDDFVKKQSIISFSKDALKPLHSDIECFAENEGLFAHRNSIAVRFSEE
ncbi:MAG: histidinol dehydrogenase [Lachnospiraceae bacterium]|nr:histidinol dehydrogenase [Lachnospiraceae bacterium]